MSLVAARFLISGRVQGVFFRASTRQQALRLGLDGSARNLADGRVEVIAQGEAAAMEALATWLEQGPDLAHVDAVVREPWTGPVAAGFVTGFVTG